MPSAKYKKAMTPAEIKKYDSLKGADRKSWWDKLKNKVRERIQIELSPKGALKGERTRQRKIKEAAGMSLPNRNKARME